MKKISSVVDANPQPIKPYDSVPGGNANATPAVPPYGNDNATDWFIEESRIRGGYNNTSIDYGVRAYLVDDNKLGSVKGNYLIYSGIFNSKSNFNQTNVFSNAEPITRSLDPAFGGIQKLYSAETNLLVFQELKLVTPLICNTGADKEELLMTQNL